MKDKTEDLKTLWEEAEFHANIMEQHAKKQMKHIVLLGNVSLF